MENKGKVRADSFDMTHELDMNLIQNQHVKIEGSDPFK